MPILVADLNSHGKTEKLLKLAPDAGANDWHDGHYFPNGEIECRCVDGDELTKKQCESAIRARWPRFADFLNWAFAQPAVAGLPTLDARGAILTNVTLPAGLIAFYARGATLTNVTLPAGLITLDARGATLTNVTLPKGCRVIR